MDAKARAGTITAEVSESLRGSGVEVDDVTVQQAGKRRLVRVFLARALGDAESDDGTTPIEPLSLDEVAEATRTVSSVLDESDVMGEAPYTLEVSSAGLDRPLTAPAHFRRNVGRLRNPNSCLPLEPAAGPEARSRSDECHLKGP